MRVQPLQYIGLCCGFGAVFSDSAPLWVSIFSCQPCFSPLPIPQWKRRGWDTEGALTFSAFSAAFFALGPSSSHSLPRACMLCTIPLYLPFLFLPFLSVPQYSVSLFLFVALKITKLSFSLSLFRSGKIMFLKTQERDAGLITFKYRNPPERRRGRALCFGGSDVL